MMDFDTENDHFVQDLLPQIPAEIVPEIESLLDKIECPTDYRGLQFVIALLEEFANSYPNLFEEVFEFDRANFVYFSEISDEARGVYSNSTPARGWKSKRPIYSLLFTLAGSERKRSMKPILCFIRHYFSNEARVKNEGRQESSMRAFRLLFTDPEFDVSCLDSGNVEVLANSLEEYKNRLMDADSEGVHTKNIINYCRELTHFYRLNWKVRQSFQRYDAAKIRASYSRRKIERVVGSDNLFTLALNKQSSSAFEQDNGLDGSEDLPALAIIKQEPVSESKPIHEKPDISVIKDLDRKRIQMRSVTRDVQRSHNITPIYRTVLQSHELFYLWKAIKSPRKQLIKSIQPQRLQSVLLLTLFFGRDISSICRLKRIYSEDSDGSGVYKRDGVWYLKVNHEPTAKRGKHSINDALLKTRAHSNIVIPDFMSGFLLLDDVDIGKRVVQLPGVGLVLKAVQQLLSSVNKKHSVQLSYKRIENFLSNRLLADGQHDTVILEYLTGNKTYYTRSMRHYAWYSDGEINNAVYAIWRLIFDDMSLVDKRETYPDISQLDCSALDEDVGTGSQFTPTKDAIKKKVSALQDKINLLPPFECAKSLEASIDYHNAYTIYTLYMLINASGYRAVHSPLPQFNLNLSRYGAMCISDKDARKSFSHTRIIAIPPILQNQLDFYLEHLCTMGNLMGGLMQYESSNMHRNTSRNPLLSVGSKVERLDWFLNAKHSRGNDGVFVIIKTAQQDSKSDLQKSKNISPKLLVELTEDSGNLPINFGRHYLRKYLQKSGVCQELIYFQLGHWVAGELPLGITSTFEHIEAVSELNPHLESMMAELGWKAIPSQLTRKRR